MTIVQSPLPSELRSLYINNINFQLMDLAVFHISPPSIDSAYSPIDNFVIISPTIYFQPVLYYQSEVSVTTIQRPDQTATYIQLAPLRTASNQLSSLTGINLVLGKNTIVEVTSNSLFDVAQGIWGLGIICFTVVLFKLTKYINMRAKDQGLGTERAVFRENVCILLSKISFLKEGRHRL
jgi:hypothetical protein